MRSKHDRPNDLDRAASRGFDHMKTRVDRMKDVLSRLRREKPFQ